MIYWFLTPIYRQGNPFKGRGFMSSVANGLRRLTEYKWGVTDAERGINGEVEMLVIAFC